MKVLHLIGGKEGNGSKNHLIPLLNHCDRTTIHLAVFDKGAIHDEAVQLNIPVTHLKQRSRYDLSVIYRLQKLIDQENIDILHTHGPRANLYGFLLRMLQTLRGQAPESSIVWATTLHSDPRQDFMGRGLLGVCFTKLHLMVLKKMDHYFAVSKAFRDKLLEDGITSDRVTTIYNGVQFNIPALPYTAEFSSELQVPAAAGEFSMVNPTRAMVNLEPDDFVLITVGRLHPVKGHDTIMSAIRELRNEDIDVKWLIIGNGPLEASLKIKAKEEKLEDRILFMGNQDPADVFLPLGDVLVLASISESFPLVLLEAARAKIPVIATDVGGVRDLIPSIDKGWIVPPQNALALMDAIKEAIEEKRKNRLLLYGERLHHYARDRFTVDHLAKDIEKAYQNLLEDR